MARKKNWTAEEVRRIAGKSLVDPRTIRRWLAGEPVRATSVARIRQAMRELERDLGRIG